MMAKLEFYVGDAEKHIAVLNDMAVPRRGDFINIQKVLYRIVRVDWAVDHADQIPGASLRANIVLENLHKQYC